MQEEASVESLGEWLASLPMLIGPIVTALLPVGIVAGLVIGGLAYRRHRVMALVALGLSVACGIAAVAFMTATA